MKDILSSRDRVARQKLTHPTDSLTTSDSGCYAAGIVIAFLPGTTCDAHVCGAAVPSKEEGMTRKLALAAGVLFAAVSAGTLSAQTSAAPKTNASSMQHAPAAPGQDSTKVRSSTGMKAQHAVWTKAQIEEAQEGLAKAGFYKGKATGKYDKSTRKAVREYQKANKLPVTGHLSNDLLTRLHSS